MALPSGEVYATSDLVELTLDYGPYVCQTCVTGKGWIWPTASDGCTTHQFVERCDICDRFTDDTEAQAYLLMRFKAEGFDVKAGFADIGRGRMQPWLSVVVES